jgi:hypothetical protein
MLVRKYLSVLFIVAHEDQGDVILFRPSAYICCQLHATRSIECGEGLVE